MDFTIDEVLGTFPEVHVFKLPPRQSAEGYKAAEWRENQLWTGKCKIISRGEECQIRLEEQETGKLFAMCKINNKPDAPKAVESVLDSSRYFVLRIEDSAGRYTYIGIGFSERTDAFDFNVALQEHKKRVDMMHAPEPDLKQTPSEDYSIQDGESITVDLNVKTKGKKAKKKSKSKPSTSEGDVRSGKGFNLEIGGSSPSPKSRKKKKSSSKSSSNTDSNQLDNFLS
eukprot:gb/GECH01013980.1/.p1 GENE.gb/GECH01013980.1/~~gb/GECH01013980.1/.p1  ORF type:complete len:227 (+),score=76.23 gb/GECH01013980.1/:1-681(+)